MRKLQGEELIELIEKDPLLKYKKLRSEDVESIYLVTRSPRKIALDSTEPNIRRYVLSFYEDGINAYQYLFDRASIYYTATAIQMGLLFTLRNKVQKAKHSNPKLRVDFPWLINESNLDDNAKKLAHDIRRMRTCYVHYEYIIAYFAKQQDEFEYLIRQGILRPEAANLLLSDKGSTPIRLKHLETKREYMDFINKRLKEHTNWVGSAILRLDKYKKSHNDTKITTLSEILSLCGVEAFDALTCIKWSLETLKALCIV